MRGQLKRAIFMLSRRKKDTNSDSKRIVRAKVHHKMRRISPAPSAIAQPLVYLSLIVLIVFTGGGGGGGGGTVEGRINPNSNTNSQQQQQQQISLRQILVPTLISQRDEPAPFEATYSPNNRGIDFEGLKARATRFGERKSPPASQPRRDAESAGAAGVAERRRSHIVWSQPDPRKSYSPPISMVKVYTSGASFLAGSSASNRARKLKIGETLKRSSSRPAPPSVGDGLSAANEMSPMEADEPPPAPSHPVAGGGQWGNQHSSDGAQNSNNNNNNNPAARRKSQSGEYHQPTNMVTLVKYVPILVSVPADSVINLSAAPAAKAAAAAYQQHKPESQAVATTQAPPAAATYLGVLKPVASPVKLVKYHAIPSSDPSASLLDPDSSGGLNSRLPNLVDSGGGSSLADDQPPSPLEGQQFVQQQQQQQPATAIHVIQQAAIPASASAANEISLSMPSSAASSAKFAYLPGPSFIQASPPAPQQTALMSMSASTSKALSAYASKLMSMLRPSSFLSSPMASQQQQQQLQQHYSQAALMAAVSPPGPQIFLLAPADEPAAAGASVGTAFAQSGGRQQQQSASRLVAAAQQQQLKRPEDSMINQASKQVQHSTPAALGRSPKVSQQQQLPQANGLICVQGLLQAKGQPLFSQPVLASPFESANQEPASPTTAATASSTTTANSASQQLLDNYDPSSFDYAPSATEASQPQQPPPPPSKGGRKQPKQQQRASLKESPVKLGQKLNSALKRARSQAAAAAAAAAQKQQQQPQSFDDDSIQQLQEEPIIQQQADSYYGSTSERQQQQSMGANRQLASSSSESRLSLGGESADESLAPAPINQTAARVKPFNGSQSGELQQSAPPPPFRGAATAASRRYGNGTIRSIIPFTIRDKIDLPANGARRAATESTASRQRQQQQQQPALVSTNNPVVFDDGPTDVGEPVVELGADSSGGGGGGHENKQRYSWPPNWLDEHRLRSTSFVGSSGARAGQRGQQAAAASTRQSRRPSVERPLIDYRRDTGQPPSLPLYMASSSSAGAPINRAGADHSRAPQSDERETMKALASSQVTTSSTLDGQPVALASGPVLEAAAAAGPGRRRQSAASPPPPQPLQALESRPEFSRTPIKEPPPSSSSSSSSSQSSKSQGTTVELVVESSPEQATSTAATAASISTGTGTGTTPKPANESTAATTALTTEATAAAAAATTTEATTTTIAAAAAASTRAPPMAAGPSAAAAANHSPLFEGAGQYQSFSGADNERLLTMEEFGRISESLQTNPMDLIDLQNSRSTFELPSQLESLSMLTQGKEEPPPGLDLAEGGGGGDGGDARSMLTADETPTNQGRQHPFAIRAGQQQQQQRQRHRPAAPPTPDGATLNLHQRRANSH